MGGTRDRHGGDRRLRRIGVLLAPRRRARGQGRYALRSAVRFVLPGDRRRPARGVPAEAWQAPHDPAAPDQLPGERLGDALARGEGRDRAVRRGLAPAERQTRRLRGMRPVRRPHERPRRHVLRRPDRDPPLVGRDLRPGPPRPGHRHDPRSRHPGPRDWNGGRDQRAALLHQGRVEVVQRRRLGGHQHEPVPRGVAVPRARDGRRQHRPHHRLRRRRHRGHRGGRRAFGARGIRPERRADPEGRARDDRALPGGSRCARARAALEHTRGDGHATSPEDIRLFETGL